MDTILLFVFAIPAMLLSSAVHEFSHAYTAYLLGDDTARAEGRMTLNPLAHIDPLGLIFMVVGRIGWSKPVPVNSYNFKNPALGNALVSAAGPISNFLLAIVTALLFRLAFVLGLPSGISDIALNFLAILLLINVSLGLFNLIPIPPLDGSNIVEFFLPKSLQIPWSNLSRFTPFLIILLALPFSPLFAIFNTFWYNLLSVAINGLLALVGAPQVQLF